MPPLPLVGAITATGDGDSTLVGPAGDTAWDINGGSVTVGGVAMTLSMVDQLQGGAGADTFNIAEDSTSIYTIRGGDDTDILTYGGTDWGINGVTVTLDDSTLTLDAVETLRGSDDSADTFTVSGNTGYTIDGGTGTAADILTSAGDTWTVSNDMVTVDGATYTLSDVETLRGSDDSADTFTVSGSTGYTIEGGTGTVADILRSSGDAWTVAGTMVTVDGATYDLDGIETLRGSDDSADTFTVSGSTGYTIDGGTGTETDILRSSGDTWTVSNDMVTVDGATYTLSDVETLRGSDDSADTFTVSGSTGYTIDGGTGTVADILESSASSWTIADDSVTIGTVGYTATDIETLRDTGTIDNTFTVSGSTGYTIDGGAHGATGDVLESSAASWTIADGSVTIGTVGYTAMNIEALRDTGTVDNTFTVSGTTDYEIDGGTGADILEHAAGSAWTISGDSVEVGGATYTLSNLETLRGSTANDMFTVSTDSTYDIAGNGGNDDYTLSALLTGTITGGGGVDKLRLDTSGDIATGDSFDAGGGDNDEVVLIATGNTDWSIAGTMITVGSATIASSGVEVLRGNDDVDTFAITADSDSDYRVEGGSGNDIITYGGTDWGVNGGTLTLGATVSSQSTLSLNMVEILRGGNSADTFAITANSDSDYSIEGGMGDDIITYGGTDWGVDGGTLTLGATMSSQSTLSLNMVEILRGGNSADTFTVSGTTNYEIDGGSGDDILAFASAGTWTVNGTGVGVGGATYTLSNLETLRGSTANDMFTVSADSTYDIAGNGGNDDYTLSALLTGTITGGGGVDKLRLDTSGDIATGDSFDAGGGDNDEVVLIATGNTDWSIAGTMITVGSATIASSGVEVLRGNDDVDTFAITADSDSDYRVEGGSGNDIITYGGTDWGVNGGTLTLGATVSSQSTLSLNMVEILRGGNSADTFAITANSDSDYSIEGGMGDDIITYSGTSWGVNGGTLTLGATVSSQSTLSLNMVEILRGGNSADTFTVSGTTNYEIDGGSGDDILAFASAGTWTVSGTGVGVGGATYTLSNLETLRGSTANDMFTVSADSTYDIAGNGGNDDYTLSALLTGTITGGGGVDKLRLDTSGDIATGDSFDAGGGDNDEVVLIATGNTDWSIAGTMITVGSATIASSGVEVLRGNDDVDTFAITADSDSDYRVEGGSGDDIITYGGTDWGVNGGTLTLGATVSSQSTLSLNMVEILRGGNSADTFTVSGATNYEIDGGSGDDILAFASAGTWTVSGTGVGVGGATYTLSNLETLRGSTANDMFTVSADSTYDIAGNGGNDDYTLSALLTGTITGGGGVDKLRLDTSGDIATGDSFDAGGGDNDEVVLIATGNTDWSIAGTMITVGSATIASSGVEVLRGNDDVDTFAITADSDSDYRVEGGSGNDIITYGGTDWGVNGGTLTLGATVSSQSTLSLNMVEILRGGNSADTFAITANSDSDYSIEGGMGDDIITYGGTDWGVDGGTLTLGATMSSQSTLSLNMVEILRGGNSADTFTVSGTTNYEIDGGSGDDILAFASAGTWTVSGTGVGVGGATYTLSNLETLRGSTANDMFTVSAASNYDIAGNGGNDDYTLSALLTGTITGGGGVDKLRLDTSGDIATGDSFDAGGGDNDEVVLIATGNTDWSIAGTMITVGSATIASSGVEVLRGNDDVDTFAITADSDSDYRVEGGSGDDIITYGGTDWGVNGGTLTLGATVSSQSTLSLNMVEILRGGNSADTFTVSGTTNYEIDGGSGDDILAFASAGTWTVAGAGVGVGGATYTLSNLETLRGSTANDMFTVSADGTYDIVGNGGNDDYTLSALLTGTITGGGGVDKLRLDTSGDIATGDSFDAGGGDNDEVVLVATGNTDWSIAGTMITAGSATIASSGVEVLRGNDDVDTFAITADSDSDYRVEGGSGDDIITYGGTDWGVNGGTLTLGATVSSQSTLSLNMVEILRGGNSADTFTVSGATNYEIDGGSGDDILAFASAGTWTVSGTGVGVGGATYTLSNLETLRGSTANDMFTVSADSTYDIVGNGGNDDYTLSALLTGTITGGGGVDKLRLDTSGDIATGDSFDAGGGDNDEVVLVATGNTDWSIAGTMITAGSATIASSGVEVLRGNDDVDTFAITANSNSDYRVEGGMGNDIITYSGTSWVISGNEVDLDDSNLMLTSVETLQGGSMNDMFTVNAATGLNLLGGDGDDTFNIDNGPLTGTLDGEGGTDTLDLGSITAAMAVTLSGIPGMDGFSGQVSGGVALDFDGINELDGGTSGEDSLAGLDRNSDWILGSAYSYTDRDSGQQLMFSALEDMNGGSMADDFTVNGTHAGDIAGGGGDDVLTISAQLDGSITTGSGNDQVTVEASGNVTMAINTGDDNDTVTVNGTAAGGIDTGAGTDGVTVSGGMVSNGIALGDDNDTLTIDSGSIAGGVTGGSGNDSFDIDGGTITGELAGGSDAAGSGDYMDLSDIASELQLMISGTPVADGFSGGVSGGFTLAMFSGIDRVSGSSTIDTDGMTVSGSSGTYEIVSGAGMFDTYTVGSEVLSFDSWENIQAGDAADTVNITGTHSGNIMTGGGNDMVTVSAALTGNLETGDGGDTVTVSAALTGNLETGAGGDTVTVSADLTGSLETGDGGDMVTVNTGGTVSGGIDTSGATTGDVDTVRIRGGSVMSGVVLGSEGDTFDMDSGSVAGGVSTGAGADTVTISGGTVSGNIMTAEDGDTITISGGSVADDIDTGGGVDQLTISGTAMVSRNVMLGSENDTLAISGGSIGGNVDAGAGNDGVTVSGTGSIGGNIDTAAGEDGVTVSDTAMVSGNVMLGSENDTLGISGGSIGGNVDTGAGEDGVTVSGGTVTGSVTLGTDNDTYTISDGSVAMGVSGGAGADTFNIQGGVTSGTVAGDGDADELNFSSITSAALTIDLSMGAAPDADGFNGEITSATPPVSMFTGINTIHGSTATDPDTLVGVNDTAAWTLSGVDMGMNNTGEYVANSQTLMFSELENMRGGTGNDSFIVNGAHSGNLESGDGTNSFELTAALTGMIVGGDNADTVTVTGGSVSAGVNLGDGVDTVTVNGDSSRINGGVNTGGDGDTITVNAGQVSGGIELEGGNDTLVLNGGVINGNINAGAGQDSFDINAGNIADVLAGEGDSDTLDMAGFTTALSFALTARDATAGYSGNVNNRGTGSVAFNGFMFTGVNQVVGGDAVDILTGLDAASTWDLDATDTYESGSVSLIFSALEDMQGGSMVDTFMLQASHSGNLMGGAGADVFTITSDLTGTLSGEGGNDMVTISAGSVTASVELGAGTDTLNISAGRISGGVDAGADNDTVMISGGDIQGGITGGAGDDTFDIDGGTISGTVDGEGDSDVLDMADLTAMLEILLTSVDSNGFAGNVSEGYTLAFAGIDTFNSGSHNADRVTGLDMNGVWTLAEGGSTYRSASQILNFSAIEDFVGGSANDIYNINMDHTGDISAGGGSDTININEALSGDIDTGAGNDRVDVNATFMGDIDTAAGDDRVNVSAALTGNVDTGAGDDSVAVNAILMGDVDTGADNDSVTVSAALTGNVSTGAGSDSIIVSAALDGMIDDSDGAYVGISSSVSGAVQLGTLGSTVEVSTGGSIGGGLAISGGRRNEVIVSGGTINGGIAVDQGDTNPDDSLQLEMTSGTITGDIIGGDGDDTFILGGGTISGEGGMMARIMGRSGNIDALDLSDNSADAEYRLSDLDDDGFSGSLSVSGADAFMVEFSGIGSLRAGTGTDSFYGLDRAATWIPGNSYRLSDGSGVSLLITTMENLFGGSAVDTFNINSDYTGDIEGGGGDDVFSIGAVVTGSIHGDSSSVGTATGTDSFTLTADGLVTGGIEGGMGTDTFNAPDIEDTPGIDPSMYMLSAMNTGTYTGSGQDQVQAFSGMENINAGAGSDTVVVADGAGLGGSFNGAGGENKLDFSAYTTAVTLTVEESTSVADGVGFDVMVSPFAGGASGGALNINSFTGGSSTMDELQGIEDNPNVVSSFGGNFVIEGGVVTEIVGGAYSAVDVTDRARFAGRVMDYSNVEIIAGGAAEDVFTLADDGEVRGGQGTDSLDFTRDTDGGISVIIDGVDADTGYSGTVVGADLSFEGVDRILGSSFSDTITGMTTGGRYQVEGTDLGVYQGIDDSGNLSSMRLRYNFVERIAGREGADIFHITDNGRQTGGIDGGEGIDTMDFSEQTGTLTMVLGVTADGARGQVYLEGADGGIETIIGRAEETRTINGNDVTFDTAYWSNIDKIVGAAPIFAEEGEARGNSFLVVQPETAGVDLIVNRDKTEDDDVDAVAVTLPDLTEFEGFLFLGGSGISMEDGADPGGEEQERVGGVPFPINGRGADGEERDVMPLPLTIPPPSEDMADNGMDGDDMDASGSNARINARRLVIGGDVAYRGSVVLLGSSIVMEADLAAGIDVEEAGSMMDDARAVMESAVGSDYSVFAVATGHAPTSDSFGEDENGYIIPVLDMGERERNILSGKSVLAAASTVRDSFNFRIDLGGGDLQYAQGLPSFVFFNPASNFVGRSLNPTVRNYLTVDLNMDIVEFILSVFNPASSLTNTDALFIDAGLFEEDLTLFSTVGRGIAMYISMCEELDNCAPPISVDVIDQFVAAAEERLVTLEEYARTDPGEAGHLDELLWHYRRVVRDMRQLKREWFALLGIEVEVEDDVPGEELTGEMEGEGDVPGDEVTGEMEGEGDAELLDAFLPFAQEQIEVIEPAAAAEPLLDTGADEAFPAGDDATSPQATPEIPVPLRSIEGVYPDDTPGDTEPGSTYDEILNKDKGTVPVRDDVPQLRADNPGGNAVVSQR